MRAGIVGGAIGLLGWFLPAVVGGGDNLTQEMLIGAMPLAVVFGVIVIRWFLGPLSYSIGTPGGLFAPLLVLGAALGTVFAGVLGLISSDLFGDPVAYALVALAALSAAVVRQQGIFTRVLIGARNDILEQAARLQISRGQRNG